MATILPSAPPMAPAVMRILGRYDRAALVSFISVAIDLLDVVDGDPDVEANGDELDGNRAEDEFVRHAGNGPGCPLSDPDMAVDDDRCDEPFQDMEREQMVHDVPNLPIWSIEPGADGQRELVGRSGERWIGSPL